MQKFEGSIPSQPLRSIPTSPTQQVQLRSTPARATCEWRHLQRSRRLQQVINCSSGKAARRQPSTDHLKKAHFSQ